MPKQHAASPDAGFLLTGVLVWLLSTLLLLTIAAAAVYALETEEASLGYIISAISFLSAAAAGFSAAKKRGKAAIYAGLLVGTAVICLALTLGFLIAGNRITADSVLSLVTFTMAGSLAGCVLPNGKENRKKKKFSFSGKKS